MRSGVVTVLLRRLTLRARAVLLQVVQVLVLLLAFEPLRTALLLRCELRPHEFEVADSQPLLLLLGLRGQNHVGHRKDVRTHANLVAALTCASFSIVPYHMVSRVIAYYLQ